MFRPSLVLLALLLLPLSGIGQSLSRQGGKTRLPVMFWNCENFFDVADDTLTLDDDFTPQGTLRWTPKRYAAKRTELMKAILSMGDVAEGEAPVVVGLSEVENDAVLRDLCMGTPLRNLGYDFVHYDSPDRRGIDCALLYRKDFFRPLSSSVLRVSDSSEDFYTRDILRVLGLLTVGKTIDTLEFFVCHLPSKLGGSLAEERRTHILQEICDTLSAEQRRHPSATLFLMGDFNDDAGHLPIPPESDDFPFVDLSKSRPVSVFPSGSQAQGSYCYQGHWNTIDRMVVSRSLLQSRNPLSLYRDFFVFAPESMLSFDAKRLSLSVRRTYLGPRYLGGASDHLPVGILIEVSHRSRGARNGH